MAVKFFCFYNITIPLATQGCSYLHNIIYVQEFTKLIEEITAHELLILETLGKGM